MVPIFSQRCSLYTACMTNEELLTRGVEEVVPRDLADAKLKAKKPLRIYLGIDPTGAKLHLGHSVPLRKLKAFADAGHHVIFLVGSFTAMIGDPTGRDTQREPLTKDQIEENFKTYKQQAGKILDFGTVEIRYNHEWLEKLSSSEILALSSHFTTRQMSQREMFKRREKEGKEIAITEFLYPLLVGYDSVMLDVDCELGGNDQLFNMLAGRTLQQVYGKRDKFVLTTKLIEGTDGRKMSKTYDNCVFIEDEPNDMYGKIMRIKDDLILTYMECCTNISMKEIEEVEKAMKKGVNPKEFKMQLAREIVTMYHDASAAEQAENGFQKVFSKGGMPDDMPETKAKKGESLIDLLMREKLVTSKSEARRLIDQKAIAINEVVVTSHDQEAKAGVVKVGKRKFVRVK